MIVLSFDYHDTTIRWPQLVMCMGRAGRGRKAGRQQLPWTRLSLALGLLAELGRLMSGQSNLQRSTCMNKRGGGLLVAGVAPALAEGTAGVKLAGRTECHRCKT